MASDPFLVGVFYGFVPAMGFLYILLREYHSLFNEKRMFRTFFVGLMVGLLATVISQYFQIALLSSAGSGPLINRAGIVALTAALLALLEALIFAAVLNWKSFRGRRDTPFYGVAFGLGFGATNVLYVMGWIVAGIYRQATEEDLVLRVALLSLLGLLFAGSILGHAAMGARVGHGSGTGPLPRAVWDAAGIRFVFYLLFFPLLLIENVLLNVLPLVALAFGLYLIQRTITRTLDRIVPPEILREMGIHHRRIARAVSREADEDGPPPDQDTRNRPGLGS